MIVLDFYPLTGINVNSREAWPIISFDPNPISEPKKHEVESYRSQQKKAKSKSK